jgi:hypothetical protein
LAADIAALGKAHWAVAEGYIPSESSFSDPVRVSHETAYATPAMRRPAFVSPCSSPIANAHILLRWLLSCYGGSCHGGAAAHAALAFQRDVPDVVQCTRLDSRRAKVSLLSTIAYAEASAR